MEENQSGNSEAECPICGKYFAKDSIEVHVNRCIFLNSNDETANENNKRSFSIFSANKSSPTLSPTGMAKKKVKSAREKSCSSTSIITSTSNRKTIISSPSTSSKTFQSAPTTPKQSVDTDSNKKVNVMSKSIPLAEKMRPDTIEDYIGQSHIMGKDAILRKILDKNETPSMILWGPPGVGKTTLAHVIANRCKQTQNTRFVKLSATMAGVNDIKQAVAVAKNEQKFGRKTIMFMDEIHRFNKLQQVIFEYFESIKQTIMLFKKSLKF